MWDLKGVALYWTPLMRALITHPFLVVFWSAIGMVYRVLWFGNGSNSKLNCPNHFQRLCIMDWIHTISLQLLIPGIAVLIFSHMHKIEFTLDGVDWPPSSTCMLQVRNWSCPNDKHSVYDNQTYKHYFQQ